MKNDTTLIYATALIYARLSRYNSWEERDEKSYKINDLREEYRNLLYSEEGLRMIRAASDTQDEQGEGTGRQDLDEAAGTR